MGKIIYFMTWFALTIWGPQWNSEPDPAIKNDWKRFSAEINLLSYSPDFKIFEASMDESDTLCGGGIEYYLTRAWSLGLKYSAVDRDLNVRQLLDRNDVTDLKLKMYEKTLVLTRHFKTHQKFSPYIGIGIGTMEIDLFYGDDYFNWGAGGDSRLVTLNTGFAYRVSSLVSAFTELRLSGSKINLFSPYLNREYRNDLINAYIIVGMKFTL